MIDPPEGFSSPASRAVMTQIVIATLPIAAAAIALLFRDKTWVRVAAVVMTLLSFSAMLATLVAPHRIAEELLATQPGPEWLLGARATRDVAHGAIPAVVSSIVALAVLALISRRKRPSAK